MVGQNSRLSISLVTDILRACVTRKPTQHAAAYTAKVLPTNKQHPFIYLTLNQRVKLFFFFHPRVPILYFFGGSILFRTHVAIEQSHTHTHTHTLLLCLFLCLGRESGCQVGHETRRRLVTRHPHQHSAPQLAGCFIQVVNLEAAVYLEVLYVFSGT